MMLLVLALATADVPSFDCKKASTNVEKMICIDPELAAVDRAVARLYAGVSRSDRRRFFTSQADWLKSRDRCEDKDCLLATYDDRFFDLFPSSKVATRYGREVGTATLSVLNVGGGWYAFMVVGLWFGAAPGQVHDTMEYGHFTLINGKAEEPPGDDYCGWRIERPSRDRWQFTELLPDDANMIGCGGLHATATGNYSR